MAWNDLEAMFSADMTLMLKEAGSKVVYGAFSTGGILTHEPTDILQMGLKQYSVLDTKVVMTIQTGSIGTINKAVNILVDDVPYEIHSWIYVNDGLEQQLDMSLVTP